MPILVSVLRNDIGMTIMREPKTIKNSEKISTSRSCCKSKVNILIKVCSEFSAKAFERILVYLHISS